MNKPIITVYIASHNYGRYLSKAVDSVLRQSYGNWELIIIDDASSDETPEVIRRYCNHGKIRTVRTEGIGLPAVCNLAVSMAEGDYIIRLDGDDVFDDNILLVLGHYLDHNPEVALVFPDYFLVDEFGHIFAHEYRQRLYDDNHLLDMPPNGACTLIRKSVLDEVGGYREDLGAQDGFDLWSKISGNYRAHNINLPLFYYRRHGLNLTTNTRRILFARRQIKLDAVRERLASCRPVIAVIPCRKHYDFVEDLWNVSIKGQSLLERGIAICLESELIDHVVVTCDNPVAEHTVNQFNDSRVSFDLRDEKSTIISSNIAPTVERIVRPLDPEMSGIAVLRFIQTPFVTSGTLDEAITTLVMNEADSAAGVEPLNSALFRRTAHGLESLTRDTPIYSDFDTVYRDSRTVTAARNQNLKKGSVSGAAVGCFEVSAAESFFINSGHELRLAELMMHEHA